MNRKLLLISLLFFYASSGQDIATQRGNNAGQLGSVYSTYSKAEDHIPEKTTIEHILQSEGNVQEKNDNSNVAEDRLIKLLTFYQASSRDEDDKRVVFNINENTRMELNNMRITTSLLTGNSDINPRLSFMKFEIDDTILEPIYLQADFVNNTNGVSESGEFVLAMKNLSMKGVVDVSREQNGSLNVVNLNMTYRPEKIMIVATSKGKSGTRITETLSSTLQGTIAQHFEQQLHSHLDTFVKDELNIMFIDNTAEYIPYDSLTLQSAVQENINQTVPFNKIIDDILDEGREYILSHELDTVTIPNISVEKSAISFEASGGWFKNVSTLRRSTEATATTDGNSVVIFTGFEFQDLSFGYDNYRAKVLKVPIKGKLMGSVDRNSLIIKTTITFNVTHCSIILNELRVNQLSGLKIQLTGMGPLNWIISKIGTLIINRSKGNIIEMIERDLRSYVQNVFANFFR